MTDPITQTRSSSIRMNERVVTSSSGTAYRLAELIDEIMHTDDPEVIAMFDEVIEDAREEFKEYVTQCIDNARSLELTIDSIDQEIERLKTLKTERVVRSQRLRDAVKKYCEVLEVSEIITDLYTVRIKKNPPAVEIINEEFIDAKYWKSKETRTIDKKMIADELKSGNEVIGASLRISTRLEIK